MRKKINLKLIKYGELSKIKLKLKPIKSAELREIETYPGECLSERHLGLGEGVPASDDLQRLLTPFIEPSLNLRIEKRSMGGEGSGTRGKKYYGTTRSHLVAQMTGVWILKW